MSEVPLYDFLIHLPCLPQSHKNLKGLCFWSGNLVARRERCADRLGEGGSLCAACLFPCVICECVAFRQLFDLIFSHRSSAVGKLCPHSVIFDCTAVHVRPSGKHILSVVSCYWDFRYICSSYLNTPRHPGNRSWCTLLNEYYACSFEVKQLRLSLMQHNIRRAVRMTLPI